MNPCSGPSLHEPFAGIVVNRRLNQPAASLKPISPADLGVEAA